MRRSESFHSIFFRFPNVNDVFCCAWDIFDDGICYDHISESTHLGRPKEPTEKTPIQWVPGTDPMIVAIQPTPGSRTYPQQK